MKKKTILFILILFSVFGIYAQNKNNSSSKIQLYAGVDMGFAGSNLVSDVASGFFGGFEITPYFGLKPFSKIKGLAFEVAVQMDFMNRTVDETAIDFSAYCDESSFGSSGYIFLIGSLNGSLFLIPSHITLPAVSTSTLPVITSDIFDKL